MERLKAIANEVPNTAEAFASDTISEKSGEIVPSTSAEVSNIRDIRRDMKERKKRLPTFGEEIEMDTYRIRNEKDPIVNNKLADDIRDGNMSEEKAEKIYNLYRNGHITFEEVREFRGPHRGCAHEDILPGH